MIGKAGVIMVIGFASILGYISMNMTRMATHSVGNMSSYNEATASHELATAGANVGLARFYADTTIFPNFTQTLNGRFKGSFSVSLAVVDSATLRLRSVSSYVTPSPHSETLHDTVEVYFDRQRQQSFSMFAWMTNNEGGVNWITKDTVWGRVHSNSTITVSGSPVFMGKLTTTNGFNRRPGRSPNYAIFKNGYETGVPRIDFPSDLSELRNNAMMGGKKCAGNVWLTFSAGTAANNDGKVYISSSSGGAYTDSISLNDGSFNGAFWATGNVHVQGTVDGKVSIGAAGNIMIDNDIVYANRTTSSSDDLLGLVSESDILVADNAQNNSDCEIDGCIFARTGSFGAENYSTRPVSGELRITGSIVQNDRGPVGTFSGSTIQHGFSKRYRYDSRLNDPSIRPPFFPGYYAKSYSINNWWESFRVPDINPD